MTIFFKSMKLSYIRVLPCILMNDSARYLNMWWFTQCKKLINAADDSLALFISRVRAPLSFLRLVKKCLQLLLIHLHAIADLLWQQG